MGNCISNCRFGGPSNVVPIREYVVLLLGIDGSGKTTLLANISKEPTEDVTPTIGFSSSKLIIRRHHVNFYDLGGNSRTRDIWKNYFSEAYGAVFMVDSNASDRFSEATETLQSVLKDSRMKGKPVAVFANKQDQEGAISAEHLRQELGLEEPMGDVPTLTHVVPCIALKSASRGKQDPAISHGVFWLLKQMRSQYVALNDRVTTDVTSQRQEEAQRRKERADRVRLIKEERERQKKLAGVTVNEEESNDTADGIEINPFKPISQAVIETEAREKAIKAQNKEIAKRLKALEDNNQTHTENGIGASTTNGEIVAGNGRDVKVAFAGLESSPALDGGGEVTSTGDDRMEVEIHSSSVTSGLSSSSDSLTDVTPGSTDSPNGSAANLHSTIQFGPDVSVKLKRGDTRNKQHKRKSTLLSRIKNRSKTAPMQQPPQLQMVPGGVVKLPLEPPRAPAALAPLRVTPSLSPAVSPTLSRHSLSPLQSRVSLTAATSVSTLRDFSAISPPPPPSQVTQVLNIQGLPDLPPLRHGVPAVQAMSELRDYTSSILHTEEDVRNIPLNSVMKLSIPPRPSSIQT